MKQSAVVKLSDNEASYLLELDASPAGRFTVAQDDSEHDKNIKRKLTDKGLAILSECGEYLEITDHGREVAADYL